MHTSKKLRTTAGAALIAFGLSQSPWTDRRRIRRPLGTRQRTPTPHPALRRRLDASFLGRYATPNPAR